MGKVSTHDLLRGALGSFKVLYGDGRLLFEYAKVLGDPSFEEAYSSLRDIHAIQACVKND